MPVIRDIIENYSHKEVYAFGFTYIIWTVFYEQLKKEGIRFSFDKFTLFHGGGWKKMKDLAVSKETFSGTIAELFGTETENILDFYGMAEQTGIIFVDCACGNKHVPAFSQVIIRDPFTLEPCSPGKHRADRGNEYSCRQLLRSGGPDRGSRHACRGRRLPVRAQRQIFPVCLTGGESRGARVRRYVPGVALK